MSTFRLARVRRLRTQLRTLVQHEADTLAAAAAAVAARRRELDAARVRRGEEEAAAAAAGLLAPETLQLGRTYDAALADAEEHCRLEAERIAAALAAKRAALAEARREERKLELLEEAHRRRTADDEARASGVLLDELAIVRHGRTRPRSGHGEHE